MRDEIPKSTGPSSLAPPAAPAARDFSRPSSANKASKSTLSDNAYSHQKVDLEISLAPAVDRQPVLKRRGWYLPPGTLPVQGAF